MKTAAINPSFEIDISDLMNPTSIIAVLQSINTLTAGDILKVVTCNQNTVMAVISYCKSSGNTLMQKDNIDDETTIFIKKA
jgi:TusA-related sulfurtransferase